jgi:predicted amidohydrolase YtcJ
VDAFKRFEAENKLDLRLYVMIRESMQDIKEKAISYRNTESKYLVVRSIKRSIDGALGPHGAWMLAPYTDLPSSSGLNLVPIEEMKELANWCFENNFQFNTHAIGDRANRETLDIYQEVFTKNANNIEHRWRIEHAQHIDPTDIPRFASLGILASMQSVHCTSDGPWVPKRIGDERAVQGAYVWRKLIETNARINNGTDVPVESIDPIINFYAAVTRMMNNDSAFYPSQKMTRIEALKSFTINNAYAAFLENKTGSIKVGKWADFTILDKDLLELSDDKIKESKILYTIIAGKVKYKAN